MNQREHQLSAIERSHDQPFVSRSREVIHSVLVAVFLTVQRIMMMHDSQERRASSDVSSLMYLAPVKEDPGLPLIVFIVF